ncbi:hypothetical protein FRC11_008157 [Ceratobasidium sp. 423]|nr:hypothetical protein FRC11_008157 [Ceratobasidium sp. 423]
MVVHPPLIPADPKRAEPPPAPPAEISRQQIEWFQKFAWTQRRIPWGYTFVLGRLRSTTALSKGSPIISLKSSGFFYDTSRFLSPEGNTLTDHNPIRVEFAYNLASGLRQSDLYGGPHGIWFNDLPSIPSSPRLSSITLRGANRLDGLSLTLASGQTFTHGGSGGDPYSLTLASGEYVTSVKLCWGARDGHTRNFYAQATTNQGKSAQAGKTASDCATATAPSGYGVVGTYVHMDRMEMKWINSGLSMLSSRAILR